MYNHDELLELNSLGMGDKVMSNSFTWLLPLIPPNFLSHSLSLDDWKTVLTQLSEKWLKFYSEAQNETIFNHLQHVWIWFLYVANKNTATKWSWQDLSSSYITMQHDSPLWCLDMSWFVAPVYNCFWRCGWWSIDFVNTSTLLKPLKSSVVHLFTKCIPQPSQTRIFHDVVRGYLEKKNGHHLRKFLAQILIAVLVDAPWMYSSKGALLEDREKRERYLRVVTEFDMETDVDLLLQLYPKFVVTAFRFYLHFMVAKGDPCLASHIGELYSVHDMETILVDYSSLLGSFSSTNPFWFRESLETVNVEMSWLKQKESKILSLHKEGKRWWWEDEKPLQTNLVMYLLNHYVHSRIISISYRRERRSFIEHLLSTTQQIDPAEVAKQSRPTDYFAYYEQCEQKIQELLVTECMETSPEYGWKILLLQVIEQFGGDVRCAEQWFSLYDSYMDHKCGKTKFLNKLKELSTGPKAHTYVLVLILSKQFQFWSNLHYIQLPSEFKEAQLEGIRARYTRDQSIPKNAIRLFFCTSCRKTLSVCKDAFSPYKESKVKFIQGFRDVVVQVEPTIVSSIDTSKNSINVIVRCYRKKRKKDVTTRELFCSPQNRCCSSTTIRHVDLAGGAFWYDSKLYTICSAPRCGSMMIFHPSVCKMTKSGFYCNQCSEKDFEWIQKTVVRKKYPLVICQTIGEENTSVLFYSTSQMRYACVSGNLSIPKQLNMCLFAELSPGTSIYCYSCSQPCNKLRNKLHYKQMMVGPLGILFCQKCKKKNNQFQEIIKQAVKYVAAKKRIADVTLAELTYDERFWPSLQSVDALVKRWWSFSTLKQNDYNVQNGVRSKGGNITTSRMAKQSHANLVNWFDDQEKFFDHWYNSFFL